MLARLLTEDADHAHAVQDLNRRLVQRGAAALDVLADPRAPYHDRPGDQSGDQQTNQRDRRHLPGDQGQQGHEHQRGTAIDDHEQVVHGRLANAIAAAVEGIDLPALCATRDSQIVDREEALEQADAEVVRDARASPGQEAYVGEVEQASADDEQDDGDADHDQTDVRAEQRRIRIRQSATNPPSGVAPFIRKTRNGIRRPMPTPSASDAMVPSVATSGRTQR